MSKPKFTKKGDRPWGEKPRNDITDAAIKRAEKKWASNNLKDLVRSFYDILKKEEPTNSDLAWIIRDFVGEDLYDFCCIYQLDYSYLSVCFEENTPIDERYQMAITGAGTKALMDDHFGKELRKLIAQGKIKTVIDD